VAQDRFYLHALQHGARLVPLAVAAPAAVDLQAHLRPVVHAAGDLLARHGAGGVVQHLHQQAAARPFELAGGVDDVLAHLRVGAGGGSQEVGEWSSLAGAAGGTPP